MFSVENQAFFGVFGLKASDAATLKERNAEGVPF